MEGHDAPGERGLKTALDSVQELEAQCIDVYLHHERCTFLVRHCRDLLQLVQRWSMCSRKDERIDQVLWTCDTVRECVQTLRRKSLAWALLRYQTVENVLNRAEGSLKDAFGVLKLDAISLQHDLKRIQEQECRTLNIRLESLVQDEKTLENALQSNEYPLKELTTAVTKHIRSCDPPTNTSCSESACIERFLRTAAGVLQKSSGRTADFHIPNWCLTRFDVDMDSANGSSLLGRGAFGHIFKGSLNGEVVAIKELSDAKKTESFRHEVNVWSRLTHPNVLSLIGASLEAATPFIVSKYCHHGNALTFLHSHPHANKLAMLHDISLGMAYLHQQSVIHADLKASNILIGDEGQALIGDFGLAHVQDQVSSSINVTRISTDRIGGTLRWMAPEVLEGKGLSRSADVYGFALTAWEIYAGGAVPYADVEEESSVCERVVRGERPSRPDGMEEEVWNLVQAAWSAHPRDRPDFGRIEVLLHGLKDGSRVENKSLSMTPSPPYNAQSEAQQTVLLKGTQVFDALSLAPTDTGYSMSMDTSRSKGRETSGRSLKRSPTSIRSAVGKRILSFCKSQKPEHQSPTKSKGHDAMKFFKDQAFFGQAQRLPSVVPVFAGRLEPPSTELVLAFLYNLSLTSSGVPEILSVPDLLPHLPSRLSAPDAPANELYLCTGILANLACNVNARNMLLSHSNLVPTLAELLRPTIVSSIQENATRCLYNLSTSDESHAAIAKHGGTLAAFATIISDETSTSNLKNVLGCLINLSYKAPGRRAILATPQIISSLSRLLSSQTESSVKEQALLFLGNLAIDEGSAKAIAMHKELIPSLASCLRSSPLEAQTLRCLRNLSICRATHEEMLREDDIASSLMVILSDHVSSNRHKYALHLLHRLLSSGTPKQWTAADGKRMSDDLQWFAEHGSSEERTRASSCREYVLKQGIS